ncbi:MAG: hypothetical protein ABIP97_04490 [Chthoniobacterales bacterium]
MSDNNNNPTDKNRVAEDKLASSQEHARKAVEATKKAAQSAYEESKQHISAAAQDLGEAANAKYGEIRNQVGQAAQDYSGRARDAWTDATVCAKGFQEESEQYIRENPLQAVGVALGIGFILGLIFRR